MKRFLFILMTLFSTYSAIFAQISGQFISGQDGHIYFQAFNTVGYPFNVSLTAASNDRSNSEVITVGQGFILGPSTPWRWYWKASDIITVTYPNGQSVSWQCPANDSYYGSSNPTFKGKHCSGSVGCSCSGFAPIKNGDVWQESYCKNCKHKKSHHH